MASSDHIPAVSCRFSRNPVHIRELHATSPERRTVEVRGYIHHVLVRIGCHHIASRTSANVQAFSLANSEEKRSVMGAKNLTCLPLNDVALLFLEGVQQKRAQTNGANEANAIRVWLGFYAQSSLCAQSPNLCLGGNVANRKECSLKQMTWYTP